MKKLDLEERRNLLSNCILLNLLKKKVRLWIINNRHNYKERDDKL